MNVIDGRNNNRLLMSSFDVFIDGAETLSAFNWRCQKNKYIILKDAVFV